MTHVVLNRFGFLSIVVASALQFGCESTEKTMNNEPEKADDVIAQWRAEARKRVAKFELASGTVEVTSTDLDKIQVSVATHLRRLDISERDQLATEVERGVPIVDSNGVPRIGAWILENRDGLLALVRQPPRAPVMRLFVVHLNKRDDKWEVVSSGEQRTGLK
jgi:hypothetical protein